jgi:hypothetical protein
LVAKVNIGIDGIQRTKEDDLIISKNVAQIFKSPTGKEVLKYLRSITIETAHGPNVQANELFHAAGQAYIVAILEQRIAHAHRSTK